MLFEALSCLGSGYNQSLGRPGSFLVKQFQMLICGNGQTWHRIALFLGLLDPDPHPFFGGTDPDPALDPASDPSLFS